MNGKIKFRTTRLKMQMIIKEEYRLKSKKELKTMKIIKF